MATPVEWVPWDDRQKATVRKGPHVFSRKLKRLPWSFCARCGLLLLKNEATRAAVKRGCEWLDD